MFRCPMCDSINITQRIIYCCGSAINHIKCNSCGYDNTEQVTRASTTSSYFVRQHLISNNNTTSSTF